MKINLYPSLSIWNYYNRDITTLEVVSAIADKMAGYYISYSATELLKDLKLLTKKGRPNKEAKEIVSAYLHEKFHNDADAVSIINPESTGLGDICPGPLWLSAGASGYLMRHVCDSFERGKTNNGDD